jgi:hypothetical protein
MVKLLIHKPWNFSSQTLQERQFGLKITKMNRKILSAVIIYMLTVKALSAQGSGENVRIDQLFNFGWKFQAGELKNAQAVDYDDSGWHTLK